MLGDVGGVLERVGGGASRGGGEVRKVCDRIKNQKEKLTTTQTTPSRLLGKCLILFSVSMRGHHTNYVLIICGSPKG